MEHFGSLEDCVEYVTDSLDDMCFVYKYPDVPVSINFSVTDSWPEFKAI